MRCLLLLLSLTLLARAEKPFRFEDTAGRLPKTVVPRLYQIRIEPDIATATVTGSEIIELEIRQPVRQLVLNSAGLEITEATVNGTPAKSSADDAKQLLTITLEQELPPGRAKLELAWKGKLGEQTHGLFITRYGTAQGEKRALATQMEPADARRMFPCWDEPVFRAEFELTAVIPEKQTAVSNMPVAEERPAAPGRREVRFARTPSMATYLVAFALGDFEWIEEEFAGVKLRIITTEGKREQGRYALEATKQLLAFYNDYFAVPYPLPKLDQFCYPGFPMGGMENWGAIFYNDTTLLVDPATASQSNRQRVFAVVAHEIAHQWFGNLVTMAWWDNLWLNEGFASWMGTKATDRFNPAWQIWLRSAGAMEWAMYRDARSTSHPIQQRVENESEANEAFDAITYEKGQSFLRMLETYLGEEKFRAGIRAYIAAHKMGSTTTADLWSALEQASGQEVRKLAANWTEQPGFPLVRVESGCPEKPHARLTQERFRIHYADAPALTWRIPLQLGLLGAPEPKSALLEAAPLTVALSDCDAPLKANLGGIGYFRVAYDEKTYADLVAKASALSEADRLNLLNDTFALAQGNYAPITRFLDLVQQLAPAETSTAIWESMLWKLASLDSLHRGDPGRELFRRWAARMASFELERLGLEEKPGDSELVRSLRAQLIESLAVWGHLPATSLTGSAALEQYLTQRKTLSPDLRRAIFFAFGKSADSATYQRLRESARKELNTEVKRELYRALSAAADPDLAARTLAISLTDELPPGDATHMVERVAEHGEHTALAWDFARAHQAELSAKLDSFSGNRFFPELASNFHETGRADELEAFAREKLPPGAKIAVAKATDDIRFHAEFKARALPEIAAWLQKH